MNHEYKLSQRYYFLFLRVVSSLFYVFIFRRDTKVNLKSYEHLKPESSDDVWLTRSYSWRKFDFKEAIEAHRETHHPTVYNVPDAQINLFFELDMRTAKPVSKLMLLF